MYNFALHVLLFLFVAFFLITSCTNKTGNDSVLYPNGWPLDDITAPPGSRRAKPKTVQTLEYSEDGGFTARQVLGGAEMYYSGFSYNGTWSDAVSHFKTCVDKYNAQDMVHYPGSSQNYEVNKDGRNYFIFLQHIEGNIYVLGIEVRLVN